VPDATGLELLAQDLRDRDDAIVLDTLFFRDRATIIVDPARNRDALTGLRDKGYTFMASVHGVDYYPEEPRLGVLYELLDMKKVDRITVKARVNTEKPELPSVVDLFPTADHQEREIYDMFGVIFTGHPDLRRILMPEDYEGFPQRRDFPVGGEPIIFTYNEHEIPGWLEGQ
jgi:NADH-quinone oxidoreductase subunit C